MGTAGHLIGCERPDDTGRKRSLVEGNVVAMKLTVGLSGGEPVRSNDG
ncbi:MAG: hypothetical protein NTU74_21230 [Deltaproteobacteria bacterium]|nr:hypothetical protein [Deltaproteobacteria bacterium]